LIKPCEYVFLIEDDGIFSADALRRLLADYQAHPYAGFIEGVELGRWGIPMVGAWRSDDVYGPTMLETVLQSSVGLVDVAGRHVGYIPDKLVEEIDAGGLYACLTKYEHYARHEFQPYEGMAFGPDVQWGLSLRQQGYRNFIDWGVAVEHCKPDGTSIHPRVTTPVQMRFVREADAWSGQIIDA
jgi:hypothetical protein